MTNSAEERLSLKRKLYQTVVERHTSSIQELKASIHELQTSANEETKSSVGDKYETGRAMVQLEIEKLTTQLAALLQANPIIEACRPNELFAAIRAGSVAVTTLGTFYMIVNGGEIFADDEKVMCISMKSPLGQALSGKGAGDHVVLNSRKIEIRDVF